MNVEIHFFASIREAVGTASLEWKPRGQLTVSDLFEEIVKQHPAIAAFRSSVLFAVNEGYVTPKYSLQEGDRVAFLPPVSGG